MNEVYFPGLEEFYDRFVHAVKGSGKERDFILKWGLQALPEVHDILSNNVQGGYDSHRQSMLAVPVGGSVLTIGPGMGFCVFLLSEIYDFVFTAEPDEESCVLLEAISEHYITNKNRKASETVKIYHAGINITGDAVNYWETKRRLMKKRNVKGSILNFDIKGAGELRDTFREKVSRVYLHKVLSSLSIACTFEDVIAEITLLLDGKGVITWSEPSYIFTDILQVEPPDRIESKLKSIFDKHNMNVDIVEYEVSNRDGESSLTEKWTLIKVWRP